MIDYLKIMCRNSNNIIASPPPNPKPIAKTKKIVYIIELHNLTQFSLPCIFPALVLNFLAEPLEIIYTNKESKSSGEQVSDQINMAIIELSKLNDLLSKPIEEMALLEEWSLFFKYAPDPKYRDLVNSVINKNKGIEMAAKVLMEISKDEHERARLRSRRMAETDRISDLLTAQARGRAEILALLKKGVSPDEIQKMFDIT